MTLPIPTPSTLAQRFASALAQQTFSASDGTTVRLDATAPQTLEQAISIANALDLYQVYLYVRDIGLELMVTTASAGGLLPQHAVMWGVPRLGATAAIGSFIFAVSSAVTQAVSVPAGTLITIDGSVQWQVDTTVTIAPGASISVAVTATAVGTGGNLDANIAAQLVSPIAGVLSVTADQYGIAGGAAIEDVESWRARIIASIRTPGGAGTVDDYIEWSKEGGAAFVSVVPSAVGGGTLAVFIMMASGAVPTPAQVQLAQSRVDSKRPVTAQPTLYAGTVATQNVTIQLRPDNVAARAKVTIALAALFLNAGMGATLYREAIEAAIASVNGATNDLVSPSTDIILQSNEIAQLGTITWVTA
ncbi:baseplate J/gp47 family protein [Asaia bogorensis]|uniref:baseplate J/gp47 family protein n=1 Tax=Asaia bogorensis TaxID=91915 RepID=UPI000EFD62F3|nr:baseplate J/gp47 family protein [Asaia bogorensis]